MKAWDLYRNISAFLKNRLNEKLASEASEDACNVGYINSFGIGWKDPFFLKAYNAVMVVPDTLRRADDLLEYLASVAIVCAIKTPTPEALTDQMGIYADAINNLFEDDPTAGDAVFESQIIDCDFSLPTPGAPVIGVVTLILSVQLDRIYE
ncbi:MAG: hypothetical protein GXY61_03860 [Lentisphaerae bacterium]|nr:hypothetical protein [Lentisphaerota bacterium]